MRADSDPYRPFTPHWARLVGWSMLVLVAVGACIIIVGVPMSRPDQVLVVATASAICIFLHREATVALVPSFTGVTVRNVLRSRRLEWAEIIAVDFAAGGPWPMLELSSAESVAVMAIQRADGARSMAEARRLAALIEANSGR